MLHAACVAFLALASASQQASLGLPPAWYSAWSDPASEERPLLIVHGIETRHLTKPPKGRAAAGPERWADLGLGGVVCNVSFNDYLVSDPAWRRLGAALRALKDLGLYAWIYDEQGYPSGAAGGLVLKSHPQLEAKVLCYDPQASPSLFLRRAYEHTHACNNFYKARRYPNIIEKAAVERFISLTHGAYWRRLGSFFGSTIKAVFTDEPSLMAVDLGGLGPEIKKRVPVADPEDPSVKPLPTVPWCSDMEERYRERYGEALQPHRLSLFRGNSKKDRRVRRRFWALVAELVAERYFGAIQKWCREHRIASSGHTLWEERILHHVPLEGNALEALLRMDIPGLDMLTSEPTSVAHTGWLTAALPASAALLSGRRRVMTEVSDFSEKLAGKGPAGLAEMIATAAWQAGWTVTEFTLYYRPSDRPREEFKTYCASVGRMNSILKKASWDPAVLLYYPIYDLWAEYLPVAGPLRLQSQSKRAQFLVNSFLAAGRTLQRNQTPFCLVDHKRLSRAEAQADGTLHLAGHSFRALILPEGVELPSEARAVVESFKAKGGLVLETDPSAQSAQRLLSKLPRRFRLSHPSPWVSLGAFRREHRTVLLLVNTERRPYKGTLSVPAAADWLFLDPRTGAIKRGPKAAASFSLELKPLEVVIAVGKPVKRRN